MRTLIYAMPSSGATFVAWQLAQGPNAVGILDLGAFCRTPEAVEFPDDVDVVVKANAWRGEPYEAALERFAPDQTIIVTREEDAVRESLLRREAKANRQGVFLRGGKRSVNRMLEKVQAALDAGKHDSVVRYEDAASDGIEGLSRGLLEIALYNHEVCAWCRHNKPQKWGFGGIRVPGATDDERRLVTRCVKYWGYEVEGKATKFSRYFANHGLPSVVAQQREATA